MLRLGIGWSGRGFGVREGICAVMIAGSGGIGAAALRKYV